MILMGLLLMALGFSGIVWCGLGVATGYVQMDEEARPMNVVGAVFGLGLLIMTSGLLYRLI